jgi:hypothetical protein
MRASVSIPDDFTATQFRSRMKRPPLRFEQIAEREAQLVCLSGRITYESVIGPVPASGDLIAGIDNWRNPTLASATVAPLSFAQRSAIAGVLCPTTLPLVSTFSLTETLAHGSAIAGSTLNFAPVCTIAGTFGFTQPSTTAGALAPQRDPTIETAISQIEEFRSRQDGWKGPNSFGPTNRAIDDAKTFAEMILADRKIEPPHIGLAADGEITFFWQNPKITLDLTIAGDGTYSYFAKPVVGPPFFEDAAPVSKNFSEEIFSLMRREA